MSGNTENTSLWAGADIFIAPLGTVGPTDLTAAWASGWATAGLLDGEEGITQERDEDTGEFYAWGGVLYKRTRSKHKRTFKFVALEDNPIIFDLVNPGSVRTTGVGGLRSAEVKVPIAKQFAFGMELREGEDKTKRRFAKVAEVQEVSEIKESETDPTVYEITVLVFPEADGTLFSELDLDPEYVAA